MAEAAKRASANTELYIGGVRAKIGLFGTKADPTKEHSFETAGPNGGVLRFEQRAVEKPVGEESEHSEVPVDKVDALTGAPASDAPMPDEPPPAPSVEGEFKRVLVEEGSGEEVAPEDVRRGVRMPNGSFIDCTDQIAAIEARTKLDRIDVVACIDSTIVRRERVIGAYYIGAQDTAAKAPLRALYEALRVRREVAVVKYTTRSRQNLGVVMPHAKTGTLVLLQLVFAEDFREAPAKATAIATAQISERHVEMMEVLLESLHDTGDVFEDLRDDAVRLREELLVRARAGEMDATVVPALPEPEDVSLEDALKASLSAVRAGKV